MIALFKIVFVRNYKNLKYIHPVCIKLYLGKKVVMMDLENSRRICLFVHVVMGGGKFENRIFDLPENLNIWHKFRGEKSREIFQIFGHNSLYSNIWAQLIILENDMADTRKFLGTTQPISSSSVDPSVRPHRVKINIEIDN